VSNIIINSDKYAAGIMSNILIKLAWIGLLTVLNVVGKLLGIFTWSWWWVLAPLWAPVAGPLIVLFVILLIEVVRS